MLSFFQYHFRRTEAVNLDLQKNLFSGDQINRKVEKWESWLLVKNKLVDTHWQYNAQFEYTNI